MIYIDKIGHLITDGPIEELHGFARKLGLRRSWFQGKSRHPHYDCTTPYMRTKAVAMGARYVHPREIVDVLKRRKEKADERT